MKSKTLKAFATATAVLGASHVIVQAEDKTTPLEQIENPFKDLSDDAALMKRAIETIMEQNFPELWNERNGGDIAMYNTITTFEEVQAKSRHNTTWEKEDICALFHLTPTQRLAFFKQLDHEQKQIPLVNDDAVLLADGMTREQIKEFRRINTRQDSYRFADIGALIDSVLEAYLTPDPLYANKPEKVIKNAPVMKKPQRFRDG